MILTSNEIEGRGIGGMRTVYDRPWLWHGKGGRIVAQQSSMIS